MALIYSRYRPFWVYNNEGGDIMKADREKLQVAMARACMNSADLLNASGLPRPSWGNVLAERSVRPATLGKVEKALGVDVSEIMIDAKE